MTIQQAVSKLIGGAALTRQEAREVMEDVMEGRATGAQIGSLLTALRMKGETIDEITGFAETMRSKSNHVHTVQENLLDTCGTGGSGVHKFNISTVSGIIAASQSVRVAKHGNRAMSGKTAGPRRELGFRTVFNLLGPLTNPAGADRQLMGLFDRTKTDTVARVLQQLGVSRAMVVGSHDGLDEISISAPTQISELKDGEITTFEITPDLLGLQTYDISEISGGNPELNADIIRRVLQGEKGAYRDIVLANAGACIYISDRCSSLQEGVKIAANAIDSGSAYAKLQQLIQFTGELSHVS
jgi:anthranilate phosphoribosyltransferase